MCPRRHGNEGGLTCAAATFPVQYDLSGKVQVTVRGSQRQIISDSVYFLLRSSWVTFLLCFVLAYAGVMFLFAALMGAERDGIQCLVKETECDFSDALILSVHSMSTIGFGSIVPNTAFTHFLVSLEFVVAILMAATAGGLLFSRVNIAHSRVAFSDILVWDNLKAGPTLTFRLVNERPSSPLFDVTCSVSALVKDPKSGMRVLAPCKLERSNNMIFRAVWNIVHPLDQDSPIASLAHEDFEERFLALVVQVSGTDQTYMQKVFANKCYYQSDMRFDECFQDIMSMEPNQITVDLTNINSTRMIEKPMKVQRHSVNQALVCDGKELEESPVFAA